MNPLDSLRRALLMALAAASVVARVPVHAAPLSPDVALREPERWIQGRVWTPGGSGAPESSDLRRVG